MGTEHPPLPWYEAWFGRDYLDVYAHRDAAEAIRQVDLMERTLRPAPGARVLDLCCGGGRHAVEMVRRGYRVVGVDLSAELLACARKEADAAGVTLDLIRADMRSVVAPGAFDVVVNFFTSFGYFDADEDNCGVLCTIRASLRPGGGWMMDYLNRDQVIRTLVPHDERTVGELVVRQERRVDAARGRIEKTLTLRRGGRTRVYRESVRMYTLPELARMADEAGLAIAHVYGSSDGAPYGTTSPRLILAGTTR